MRLYRKTSVWRDFDLALCVFCGFCCGILSYLDILHVLGIIAFTAGLVPVFGKRLYDKEQPPVKWVRVLMMVLRILLALLLLAGSLHFWLTFTNMKVAFTG